MAHGASLGPSNAEKFRELPRSGNTIATGDDKMIETDIWGRVYVHKAFSTPLGARDRTAPCTSRTPGDRLGTATSRESDRLERGVAFGKLSAHHLVHIEHDAQSSMFRCWMDRRSGYRRHGISAMVGRQFGISGSTSLARFFRDSCQPR
jgi:hypothetical protein